MLVYKLRPIIDGDTLQLEGKSFAFLLETVTLLTVDLLVLTEVSDGGFIRVFNFELLRDASDRDRDLFEKRPPGFFFPMLVLQHLQVALQVLAVGLVVHAHEYQESRYD